MIGSDEARLAFEQERFLGKLAVRDDGECWEWKGRRIKEGYGHFDVAHKTAALAHRYAYEWHYGPIPEGLRVLHHCDNPPCCNPAHLFVGTDLDNTRDRVAKGRSFRPIGEAHPRSKLTEDQVRDLRQRYAAGSATTRQLSEECGILESSVGNIINRRSWKHI